MRILVVNPGSTSLKLRLLDDGDAVCSGADLPSLEGRAELEALGRFLDGAEALEAGGVRVVHGGREFRRTTPVDASVLERLEAVSELAPLHNPPALAAMRELLRLRPRIPLFACFDTAFHSGLPDPAAVYALPRAWVEDWGIRRYGFHGLSHAYASRRAAELLGREPPELRLVSCHLGAGASLTAVRGGVSVDTTMGFTPMEGLVMATRSGSVDPGVLLWVQRRRGLTAEEVEHALERESGLLGLCGSADMRAVLHRAEQGDPRAALAVAVYVHRLRSSIAAMAAALGGLDAVVFTGGVGENAARIRAEACSGLGFLGVALDEKRNLGVDAEGGDVDISAPGAAARVLVVRSREEVEVAHEVRSALRSGTV